MIETNLYFGQSKPNGGIVTEKEWKQFMETHISKVFKEGSTVINVSGNWYDTAAHQLITEPTYRVTYYHPQSKKISQQIDSLRIFYKKHFSQQSVLRTSRKLHVSF